MLKTFASALVALFVVASTQVNSVNAAAPAVGAASANDEGWIPLFNGKDLSGWHVVLTADHKSVDPDKVFQVHDGVIHAYKDVPQGVPVPIGYLASDGNYSNFDLKLEFRWGDKKFAPRTKRPRDAGVLYHAGSEQKVWPRCVECQIQEGDVGDCFTVKGVQVATTVDPLRLKSGEHKYMLAADGGIADVWGGPDISRIVKGSTHENDGWNTVEVIVRGGEEAIHKVNGHEVFRATNLQQLDSDEKSWVPLSSGRLLLQCEFAEVFYRNVQIRPLEGKLFQMDPQHGAADSKLNK